MRSPLGKTRLHAKFQVYRPINHIWSAQICIFGQVLPKGTRMSKIEAEIQKEIGISLVYIYICWTGHISVMLLARFLLYFFFALDRKGLT